ncbi:2,3-bisphosphoglycerate-dependent phosphoglycerate mutase [Bacillus pakistanensis]|uniref:2,3-bisphosphoglycerate-dependent phosphoglycerate mutase n=1 Tax=Rossellomorea pakistanensis TaxID=992288 RepID=A0ABS2N8L0_9BACI|nr:histidine phosphatase family protein [Bacillus pakistanensis]MBM7584158.1 2,3-bisphosphoglycerate-dependent phosphoglycerate mutase [Bacillus pakistanensis]
MEIILIRHGESEADILGVHEGRADFSLTELGKNQVRLMAKRVKRNFSPDEIWCSTLKRAVETAEELSKITGVPILFSDDLRELNNGIQAGKSFAEAENIKLPKHLHERIEEGESAIEFRMRIEMVFSKIIHESKSQRVAIVAHGGVITELIRAFLRLPISQDHWFHTGDTGIHKLEVKETQRVIHFMNDLNHLEGL